MTKSAHGQVHDLQSRNKRDLKQLLAQELDGAYNREITNSLRNDLMIACFKQIEPEQNTFEKVKSHENYSPSWSKKKKLATALRMVLTEHVNHPEHDGVTSLNKKVMAEIIIAIRQDGGEKDNQNKEMKQLADFPDQVSCVESPFEEAFPAEKFGSYDLYTWIVERRSSNKGEHGVYVLDCTPHSGKDEDFRIKSLRKKAYRKSNSGKSLSKIERAAQALNRGERIYYVGYASDIPNRVRQHVSGADSGGAKFTNIFKPQDLVEGSWYQTETTARNNENRRAEELTVPGESFGYAE